MAITKNILREKVAKINAKLEDHTRLRISLEHSKPSDVSDVNYSIRIGGNLHAFGLRATDASNFLEGMRSMYFILSQSR